LSRVYGYRCGSHYAASATASDGTLIVIFSIALTPTPATLVPCTTLFRSPSNMTVDEGATADQVLTATDPDADVLTFTKVAGPAFMSVTTTNATTGNVHLAPGFTDAEIGRASCRARDGSRRGRKHSTVTVRHGNRPPT